MFLAQKAGNINSTQEGRSTWPKQTEKGRTQRGNDELNDTPQRKKGGKELKREKEEEEDRGGLLVGRMLGLV